jgi:hypothetical protein
LPGLPTLIWHVVLSSSAGHADGRRQRRIRPSRILISGGSINHTAARATVLG